MAFFCFFIFIFFTALTDDKRIIYTGQNTFGTVFSKQQVQYYCCSLNQILTFNTPQLWSSLVSLE